jgi:hypothetical protein
MILAIQKSRGNVASTLNAFIAGIPQLRKREYTLVRGKRKLKRKVPKEVEYLVAVCIVKFYI